MSKKPTVRKSGQIMLEYIVVVGVMLVMIGILTLFLYVFKEHGARVMDLVASEYP